MQAQIIKAVLSQALLFGIKDILEKCEPSSYSNGCTRFEQVNSFSVCSSPVSYPSSPRTDVVLALILYARTSGRAVGVKV